MPQGLEQQEKIVTSMRILKLTYELIASLAEKTYRSKAAIVDLAVAKLAKEEGITLDEKEERGD